MAVMMYAPTFYFERNEEMLGLISLDLIRWTNLHQEHKMFGSDNYDAFGGGDSSVVRAPDS